MPKLVNHTNRVEIDGVPYRKNELKYNTHGDYVTIVYSKEADVLQNTVIGQKDFSEWTDKDNGVYATIDALITELKVFLFESDTSEDNNNLECLLNENNRLLCEQIVELKVNNRILSEAFKTPLYMEQDLT